jgi:hypothetical protein
MEEWEEYKNIMPGSPLKVREGGGAQRLYMSTKK